MIGNEVESELLALAGLYKRLYERQFANERPAAAPFADVSRR
jgi:hypothetical protein